MFPGCMFLYGWLEIGIYNKKYNYEARQLTEERTPSILKGALQRFLEKNELE